MQWASPGNSIGAKYYSYAETSGSSPVTTWYDGMGREIQKDSYGLNANKISVTTEYYSNNKVYRISNPYFEPDAASKTWENIYTYDDYGRLSTLTTPLGVSSSAYSGKTTTATTPEETKETTVNDAGQIITSKINGKAVNYTYYPSGLTYTSTPEGGQAVTMEYNLQGKRTKLTDPDGGIVESKYNGFGELTEEKQKIHNATNYITTTKNYDAAKGYPLSVVRNGETTSYTYDTNNRVSTIEIAGKNKQTFSYDGFDRVTNVKEEIGTRIYNTAKEYDALGRVKKEIYPSGFYTVNLYDSYGHLVEVKDNLNRSIWKAIDENAKGQLLHISKGGKTTTFDFYDNGLTKEIKADGVVDMFYEFYNPTNRYTADDKLNNLYSREDKLTGQKEKFRYDGMNRLTNWDVYQNNVLVKQNSMTFDATTSNITTKSDLGNLSLSYGGVRADGSAIGPHALATISGVPASFPTADLIVSYTDFKKIATLKEGNKGYKLTYGVDDQRRVSKYSVGTDTLLTRYYLGGYEEEVNSLGNVRKIHYLSGGAMLIQNNGSDSLLYAYSDNQGSLLALTDVNGNVVEKYAYDPWGARRNPTDWTQKDNRTSWLTNRGYTGHEHLDVFGIINMNGRVYDPATGMFMGPDPYIQAPKDWLNYNRYSYCMGNPFKYTDPSGKFFKELFSAIFFIISAPFSVITMGIDLLSGKTLDYAWNNSPLVAIWNFGKIFDQFIFGKPKSNNDLISGVAGTDGLVYTTSNGDKYYKFDDLKSMVNFMYHTTNDDNTLNPFHYEMVGYALANGDGSTSYYVLDWSGNTNEKSHNTVYTNDSGSNSFNKKTILAEYHTHPASYYSDKNRQNAYDGPSIDDYILAKRLGVPVYSIGPHSVSVINPNETKRDGNYFENLGSQDYKKPDTNTGSTSSVNFGGSTEFQDFTKSEMVKVNPYCIAATTEWLENPNR